MSEKIDLETIESMWLEDSKIDESDLSYESSKIPKLHQKYYKMLFRTHLKVSKLKAELKELERAKTEYYNGSMAQEDLKDRGWKPNNLKILRQDLEKYIQSDKDIIDLSLKIDYFLSLEKYLEDIVKSINTRNFIIKNMVDFLKFKNGGY